MTPFSGAGAPRGSPDCWWAARASVGPRRGRLVRGGRPRLRADLELLNDAGDHPLSAEAVAAAAGGGAVRAQSAAKEIRDERGRAAALERVRARPEPPRRAAASRSTSRYRGGEPGPAARLRYAGHANTASCARQGRHTTAVAACRRALESLRRSRSRMTTIHWRTTVPRRRWGGATGSSARTRWTALGSPHEGGLILSNNARPMPTLMVERATARVRLAGGSVGSGPGDSASA